MTSRSQANLKAYICLFVCASSRAIHLELTLDLLTESFIEALRRFIAVRGAPSLIYSDNGKTFEGASKLVAKTLNGNPNDISPKEEFSNLNIQWNFIPPRSPWWGGFYERMVQVVKKSLKRVLSDRGCNYLQFETAIKRIEGVANDRPLTSVDEDPSTKVISPSYLILGRQTTETYENEVLPLSNFTQKRLKFQETTYQTFWNIFYKEYLLQLQEYKHKNKSKDKI